jgi:predicted nuclease with TOPRIM domain
MQSENEELLDRLNNLYNEHEELTRTKESNYEETIEREELALNDLKEKYNLLENEV